MTKNFEDSAKIYNSLEEKHEWSDQERLVLFGTVGDLTVPRRPAPSPVLYRYAGTVAPPRLQ